MDHDMEKLKSVAHSLINIAAGKGIGQSPDLGAHRIHIMRYLIDSSVLPHVKTVVELGVRKSEGSSLFLSLIANYYGATLIGVDVEKDFKEYAPRADSKIFYKMSDLDFPDIFIKEGFDPIDILLIDSLHEWEHVYQQLELYMPLLSEKANVYLHDYDWSGIHEGVNKYFAIDSKADKQEEIRISKDLLFINFAGTAVIKKRGPR